MANLFPSSTTAAEYPETESTVVNYGSTVRFDFEKHEFVLSPTGRQPVLTGADAWAEWCVKAICTERYSYLIYDHDYGEEIDQLFGQSMPHEVAESEIRRMTRECLLMDKRTASVDNFSFSWIDDGVLFSCQITNALGDSLILSRKVVR